MKKTWLSIVLGVAVLMLGAVPFASAGTVCPDLTGIAGLTNPGGVTNCNVLITINPDLSLTVQQLSNQAYENIEDQLVGIVNNSNQAYTTPITLSSASTDIFGFDGDGICAFSGVAGCNGSDTTGYAPKGWSFTGIGAGGLSGTVNFPSIAAGGTAFFSLEGAPGQGGPIVVGTPEPVSLLLLAVGLVGLEVVRRKSIFNV